MPLPLPLTAGGPQGMSDIESFLKESRFVPGMFYLLDQRGADVKVIRRVVSQAPLVVGAPKPDRLAAIARDLYGANSGLAPARAPLPNTGGETNTVTSDITFDARVLLIDDNFTESDELFATDFTEQRCLTAADLHPGDVLRYLRNDGRFRSYDVTSAPMILGGTTVLLRQYLLSPATD